MSRSFSFLILASLLAVGCGEGGSNPPYVIPDGGTRNDGGVVIADAGPLPDASVDADGPTVQVLSPTQPAAGDYSSDAILTSDRVEVRCSAQKNPAGDTVDRASVRAIVHDGNGVWVEIPALPVGLTDEFTAEVSLIGFPSGEVFVRCSASDIAGRANSDEISNFVDHGPQIQIFSPMAGVTYGRQVDVIFSVTSVPMAADDALATVNYSNVEVSLAGYPIDWLVRTGTTFEGTIIFDDPHFDLPLVGEHRLNVTAQNRRTPTPVSTETQLDFEIDDLLGPEITILSPSPAQIVSGIMTVQARVEDPDGVILSTVVGTIAGREFNMIEVGPDLFEGSFDTNRLGKLMVFPNIIVRAQDTFGSQGQNGFVITLDNRGPLLDLDPPDIEEMRPYDYSYLCSDLFDPVGDDAMNDGDTGVLQLSKYRVRALDLGNGSVVTSEPGVYVPSANVDPGNVQLFALGDTTQPMVVDTDGDGFCDALNPHLLPTTVPVADEDMARLDLAPIPPGGEALYNGRTPRMRCIGDSLFPEDPLCAVTSPDVRRIIPAPDLVSAAIYGIPPLNEIQCLGNGFDSIAANIQDGWTCLAVRATDRVDNVGVSAPLRICYDHDASGGDCGAAMPDCTGTYDPVTDTVDPGTPCVQEFSFPVGEIQYLND